MSAAYLLPLIFIAVMGLAMLLYALLDGFDLGVGMLISRTDADDRDVMIASIGPFWDANETWLVFGIGVLLIAFPFAHGIILTALYLPVTIMLFGIILRGVAFDFRAKAHARHKERWDRAFCIGSATASIAQGFMLGQFIIGFNYSPLGIAFGMLIGFCVAIGYMLIGACWLIWKTEGALQARAVSWAQRAWWGTGAGILIVSCSTPLINPHIFEKWFMLENVIGLAPIPFFTAMIFLGMLMLLRRMPLTGDKFAWLPMALAAGMVVLCFHGLAFSFFPYIVPERMTIWQAAASTASLKFIFVGVAIVLPMILAYSMFCYRVFHGKATELRYD